jgi:leucyl aminopeptidase (aminopeptidase T)
MKAKWILALAAGILAAGLVIAIGGSVGQQRTGPDHEALAQRLVNQCASIHENDLVMISGGVRDVELLENLAVHVRKQGAFPMVTLHSDRMTRRMFTDVPPKYDSQTPEFAFKLASLITAQISVDYGESEGLLADLPPERLIASGKTFQPVSDLILKRNVRQVNLGNALYPTVERARQFGITQEQLSKIFWDGVNIDYTRLQTAGEKVKQFIAPGKQVQITNPNGTNLNLRIDDRPVFVSDGIISTADLQKGGPACQVWLPAGEVYLTPVPGTAEGKVVVDRYFFQGKEIQGLTLTFSAGKLVSMTARSGIEPLKTMYDASGPGKELFGAIDIGINPNVRLAPGSRVLCWMAEGMVTIGFGNNTWAGGDNTAAFGLYGFIPGSTLKVDGKILVENGSLTGT